MNVQLLKKRMNETPMMGAQDAVKLAYQSAFGCGHLLPAREICVERIGEEIRRTPCADVPLFTPVGNGLCRLNLAAQAVQELDAEWIYRMMLVTDRHVRACDGLKARFEEILHALEQLAQEGQTAFSAEEFRAYLTQYEANGGGVVSHTAEYRDCYAPAYRVVLCDCARLVPVLLRIQQGAGLVVFDGPCGSGKTTLSGVLGEMLNTVPVPMDDFFLPPEMRTPERLAEAGGNVHRERFAQEVLQSLLAGGDVRWQRFDCGTFELHERIIPKADVALIEGSYSHHPAFREAYERLGAVRVFVDVDDAEQLHRIQKRNPSMVEMFQSRWIPLEKNYFQAYDIRGGADILIPNPAREEDA